jgi:hypothetical protein
VALCEVCLLLLAEIGLVLISVEAGIVGLIQNQYTKESQIIELPQADGSKYPTFTASCCSIR